MPPQTCSTRCVRPEKATRKTSSVKCKYKKHRQFNKGICPTLLKTHNDWSWLLLASLRAVQTLLYMLLTQIGMQQAHYGDKFVMQICRKDNSAHVLYCSEMDERGGQLYAGLGPFLPSILLF